MVRVPVPVVELGAGLLPGVASNSAGSSCENVAAASCNEQWMQFGCLRVKQQCHALCICGAGKCLLDV